LKVNDRRFVLVDTNVILDIRTKDPEWFNWSANALAETAEQFELVIDPIIYAEVSVDAERIEDLDDELPERNFRRLPLPYEAGFLAGKAYVRYRRAGGARRSPCRTSISEPTQRSAAWCS
jgi:hypothetical protein